MAKLPPNMYRAKLPRAKLPKTCTGRSCPNHVSIQRLVFTTKGEVAYIHVQGEVARGDVAPMCRASVHANCLRLVFHTKEQVDSKHVFM